jgi:hypothetical protein
MLLKIVMAENKASAGERIAQPRNGLARVSWWSVFFENNDLFTLLAVETSSD